ncbi:MAG: hypothetical protein NTU53_01760 [Planctomycetota bacterium]|nr:hypothetical protein [Planctomycetota bacterium]
MTPFTKTYLALLILLAPSLATAPPNLIANGDFSQSTNGQPTHWQTAGDSNVVTQTLTLAKDPANQPYALLTCSRFAKQTPSAHAMLAQVGLVQLTKGRTYEFSCRARCANLTGRSVSIAITDTKVWANCGLQSQLPLSTSWQSCKRVFRATQSVGPSSRLQIWFNETGSLEIADVRLVEYADQETVFTDTVFKSFGKNLIPNSSFEVGSSGWSSLGLGVGWGDLESLHGQIESTGGQHGRSFLRIPLGDSQSPILYFDYYQPIVRRELRPLAASRGWIPVETNTPYTLSAYLRASRNQTPALLGVRSKNPAAGSRDYTTALKLTTTWQRYSLTFKPQHRYVFVYAGPDLAEDQRIDVDIDAIQLEKGDKPTDFSPRFPVEFSLEPAAPSGIFYDNEPARLILRAANHATTRSTLPITLRASDFLDTPITLPPQQLDVPSHSTVVREITLPNDFKGFYNLTASAGINNRTESTSLRIAIVPRPTSPDSVLGINHAFVSRNLIHLASKAGVTWYRDWSLKWQHIEPKPGEFHWDIADTQINRVLAEKTSVLPLLPPFPSADWSSEAPASLSTQGYPGVRIRQAFAPKNPADLSSFIEEAVARYKDRIHIWEFLNEPIYTDYSLPADSTNRYGGHKYTPADYVNLLQIASAAMRKSDPTCKIIGGIGSGPKQLTSDVLSAGILKSIDIFNLHLYPGLRAPEAYESEMSDLLKLMDSAGGRKPIWITEFAYYGADDLPREPFFPSQDNWAEDRLLDSERQCADYTLRFFTIMLSRGVQKIFIHSGCNSPANSPNFECPLFGSCASPRKLFPALSVFTNLLGPTPTPAGDAHLPDSTQLHAFETEKHAILILWQPDPTPMKLTLPTRPDLTYLDTMGRKLPSPPAAFSPSPMYLVAPAGSAKQLLDSLSRP